MERIGLYKQLTPFTNENAGTAEWCMAEKDGINYFVKKFQSPVYPSKDLGLPEKKYQSRVVKFHAAEESRKAMYRALRENDTSGTLVVPVEVINFQYHICTIAEYIVGNVSSNEIYKLSEWQRLVLMRTLTLALINVHRAGVVHSDMKPDNVLITQNPENGSCALKLIDFDGSFMASNPPEDAAGDPAYFAPEAYAMATMPDIRLDKRIDVFALGIIFHFFWTGKLPEKSADQTIGQCILKGESVKLDSSLPEQLRRIIERSLEGNPANRITDEQIYNELEKILPAYPVKIINLQEGRKNKPVTTRTRRTSATREIETTKNMSVPVMHCDKDGHTLRSHSIEIAYGGKGAAYAENIPGYHIISSRERIEVSVDKEGNASEYPIRFTYEKDKKGSSGGKTFFIVLLVLGLIYCLVMYGMIRDSSNSGDYEQAKQYMDLFPFYRDLFTEDYNYTLREVDRLQNEREAKLRESNYNDAVYYYQQGNYYDAQTLFSILPTTYKKTNIYLAFCNAHLYYPLDYYQTIVSNITFEDAKELLLIDNQIAFHFLLGTWHVQGGGSSFDFVAYEEDDGSWWMTNIPDCPGGGTWSIRDGFMYYTYENGNEIILHEMRVNSVNRITFKSYISNTTYSLTR